MLGFSMGVEHFLFCSCTSAICFAPILFLDQHIVVPCYYGSNSLFTRDAIRARIGESMGLSELWEIALDAQRAEIPCSFLVEQGIPRGDQFG